MSEPLALEIAQWCERVRWEDVPAGERTLARLRILDTLGLIYAALDTPAGRIAVEFAARQGGAAESSLAGTGARLPAAWTALAHATLAHARDFDDTFADSVVHPGSVVVPVALAVGEAAAATGAEVMLAIALGYEVASRLGAAAGRKLHARGFHATGVIGPLAAAVSAAKLYRLDARQTAQAMGLAGSMAGGLMEFLADGSWSKWLHTGWAAHGGTVAAQFARSGFAGPISVLEGRAGLYRAFLGDAAELQELVAGLGRDWRGSAAQFKYYPCAHAIHPYIDAVLELSAAHALSPADVTEVTCAIAPWAVPIVCEPRASRLKPQNEMQAIASLPYMVAWALAHGAVTLEALSARALSDTAVLALAERVRHFEDAALGTGFDGRVAIRMRDGREFTARATAACVDGAKVRAKFRRNAAAVCTRERIAAIEAAIDDPAFEARKLLPLYFARS